MTERAPSPAQEHEHSWTYVETVVHVEAQGKCYHYKCKGCKATQGLNMILTDNSHKEGL